MTWSNECPITIALWDASHLCIYWSGKEYGTPSVYLNDVSYLCNNVLVVLVTGDYNWVGIVCLIDKGRARDGGGGGGGAPVQPHHLQSASARHLTQVTSMNARHASDYGSPMSVYICLQWYRRCRTKLKVWRDGHLKWDRVGRIEGWGCL